MPHGQAVGGQFAAHHRLRRSSEIGAHRPGGQHTHHQTGQHQQFDRHAHPVRGLVGLQGQVGGRRAPENIYREAQRVRHAEHAGHRGGHGQQPFKQGCGVHVHGFGKEHFLGQEAVEQRHTRHGRAGHDGERCGDGHHLAQARQAADVARAAFVVHDTHGHEQRGLEGGVVHDVEHGGHGGQRAVQAEQQRDEAQVRDGGVRQQALEIVLEHGGITAHQQRGQARAAYQPEPFLGACKGGPQPRQQKNTRLDHGGRVQVCRYRRGRGHGMGQPEMEGELRALGEGPQQNQHQRREVQRMVLDELPGHEHVVQVIAADDMAQHQHARKHAQAPRARHRQGHACAAARILAVVPVADQQKRKQAGQLPEKRDLDDVA